MGQAKRRRNSWGTSVVSPMTYVAARTYWAIPLNGDDGPGYEKFMQSKIRRSARIRLTIPDTFHPDRDPSSKCLVDFKEGDDDKRLLLDFEDDGEGMLIYEDDLSCPLEPYAFERLTFLHGDFHRVAFRTGDEIEIAIDASTGGFVSRDGPIADPTFFADKMIVTGPATGHFFGEAMTLQMTAIIASSISKLSPRRIGRETQDGIVKHMAAFMLMTEGMRNEHPGIAIDHGIFDLIRRHPEILQPRNEIHCANDLLPEVHDLFRKSSVSWAPTDDEDDASSDVRP